MLQVMESIILVTHEELILDVVAKEKPDGIVFCHSSYGWDLAPRVA